MTRCVVDTNVPIVANGRVDPSDGGRFPSLPCRLAAIDFLERLLKQGRVIMDLEGEIQREYRRHLNPKGQPGVGDRFYLAVLQSSPQRVERVELSKAADGSYVDFPEDPALASFDPSDRKFVAVARRASAPVAVATDSDWVAAAGALERNGVMIDLLCGQDTSKWFRE